MGKSSGGIRNAGKNIRKNKVDSSKSEIDFNLENELKKIGFNIEGKSVIGAPVRYTNKDYFFTENFHPKELANYIKKNKDKIRDWAVKNNRNVKSALLGY